MLFNESAQDYNTVVIILFPFSSWLALSPTPIFSFLANYKRDFEKIVANKSAGRLV